MPGETSGLSPQEIQGRRVIAVARDDGYSTVLILEGGLFLKDHNDFDSNPLLAGGVREHYSDAKLGEFVDYWSEEPLEFAQLGIA